MAGQIVTTQEPKGVKARWHFDQVYDHMQLNPDEADKINANGKELEEGIAAVLRRLSGRNSNGKKGYAIF
jgi:hypothetical protein